MQASISPAAWQPSCTEDQLLIALVNVKRAFHQAGSHFTEGLEPGAFPVLHQLAISGPARQNQVAETIGLDASTVSRHVRALTRDGLIAARRDASDGRAQVLTVTEAGLAFLTEHLRARRELMGAATADFTVGERAELIRLLTKFTDAITATTQAARAAHKEYA